MLALADTVVPAVRGRFADGPGTKIKYRVVHRDVPVIISFREATAVWAAADSNPTDPDAGLRAATGTSTSSAYPPKTAAGAIALSHRDIVEEQFTSPQTWNNDWRLELSTCAPGAPLGCKGRPPAHYITPSSLPTKLQERIAAPAR